MGVPILDLIPSPCTQEKMKKKMKAMLTYLNEFYTNNNSPFFPPSVLVWNVEVLIIFLVKH